MSAGNGAGALAVAPPQNLEAEQSVLGAVLLSDTALPALIVDERLQPEDFYREGHGRIYRAMLDLHKQGAPVDALTLVEHLKREGQLEAVGGRSAVDLLAGAVPAVGNVRQYARIVRDNARRRQLFRLTHLVQGALHAGDDRELERALDELASARVGSPHADVDVAMIRRALLEDPQDTRDASGPARQEIPGSGGLAHRGVATTLFGERGGGKTMVALVVGLAAAAAGERVLYLDRENGPALTRERITAILGAHDGWGDPLLDGHFVGRHYPELRGGWPPAAFGEALAGAGFTVVIFDSTREMLDQLGIDAHKGDVSPFISLAVTPLVRRGVAVVLLDNVGHQETHRPKGDGGKLDAVPQAFKVVTGEKFSPVLTGRITLVCARSRFGDMDREWSMRVGGGVFEVPAPTSEAPDAKAAREIRAKRERFRQALVAALREEAPLGRDRLLEAARTHGAKGKTAALRAWLSELASDPASGIVSDDHSGYQLAAAPLAPQNGATLGPPPAGVGPGSLALPEGGPGPELPGPNGAGHLNGHGPAPASAIFDFEPEEAPSDG